VAAGAAALPAPLPAAARAGECVGVIGLGLLGSAIARRLAAAGYAVLGTDLQPERTAALDDAGVSAATVEEIAACALVVLAVFTSEEAGAVAERLYAAAANSPGVLVCVTTCGPAAAQALAARAGAAGWAFVEAPLSGTSAQVLAGEGVGLVAGAPQALARANAVLDAICPRRFTLARPGDAARAKLAVNLILGLNRAALAEGLVFAERMGLDGAAFLAIARGSAAASQVMDTKGAKMLAGDYAAQGRAEQALKDARLIEGEARRIGQPLPLLAVHAAMLEACVARGEGALDSSVVVEEWRRRGAVASAAAP
jgi:3-hydroxyisobutyrate dehydrogenase-like beta-hydroxyacid dehydrogenase